MRIADCGSRNSGAFRTFWITLFAIGAMAVLATGWQGGEPWTAAAFVVFFSSRVARSIVKRPLGSTTSRLRPDAARHANRFLAVTAAGWFGSGGLALIAALAGEGQEWLYVAPFFLLMGGLQMYVRFSSAGLSAPRSRP